MIIKINWGTYNNDTEFLDPLCAHQNLQMRGPRTPVAGLESNHFIFTQK